MARRRAATRRTTKSGTELVVVNASPPARRSSGGGISRRRSRRRGRRRSSSSSGGASIQKRIERVVLGGFGYGLVKKHFPDLPRIPGLGHSGTVALAVYFLKPNAGWIQDIGIAAAAIAGESFGSTGTVSGYDDVLTG